jgi:hypothetical protein
VFSLTQRRPSPRARSARFVASLYLCSRSSVNLFRLSRRCVAHKIRESFMSCFLLPKTHTAPPGRLPAGRAVGRDHADYGEILQPDGSRTASSGTTRLEPIAVSVSNLLSRAELVFWCLDLDLDLDHLFRGMLLQANKLLAIQIFLPRPHPRRGPGQGGKIFGFRDRNYCSEMDRYVGAEWFGVCP